MRVSVLGVLMLLIAILVTGCQCNIYSNESPSEVVEKFASCPSIRYHLMSSDYIGSTTEEEFYKKIEDCYDNKFIYSEFKEVKSVEVDGNNASVVIEYKEKGKSSPIDYGTEEKTIELIKEDNGWKITKKYCELVKERD